MKLLMFNFEYPPLGGGGGVIHEQIAEELAQRHEVTVVTSAYPGLPEIETRHGVLIQRVRVLGRRSLTTGSLASLLSYYPASLRAGERLIRQRRPDVINSHFAVPTGPSATRLARRHGIPHVLSIHGGDIFDPSKRLSPHRLRSVRPVVRWVLAQADRVVAPSRNTIDNARRWYGHRGPIDLIPHGLRQPDVPAASRAELGLPDDRLLLITVGRLVARKATDQLLHLLARLPRRDVDLVVVGDGPERLALEALARRLGLTERVRFTGFVEETRKHQLLAASDLFVSATTHEGFGLMYLEAMARGLPIVTYDHGGQGDFLVDGVTGAVVPAGEFERFRAGVERLLADDEWRQRIRRQNQDRAAMYSIAGCARAYERLFEEVAARTPAATAAAG